MSLTIDTYWCFKRADNIPTASGNPAKNGVVVQVQTLTPFGNAFFFTLIHDHLVAASVAHVLFASCESAVCRGVIAVVVDSVYFQALVCSICHCPLNKGFWIAPFFADTYSTAAVPSKARVLVIFASSHHSFPAEKQPVSAQPMCERRLRSFGNASARLRMAAGKIPKLDGGFGAAFTLATKHSDDPSEWGYFWKCLLHHSELAKLGSAWDNQFTHDDTFLVRLRETPGSDQLPGVSSFYGMADGVAI